MSRLLRALLVALTLSLVLPSCGGSDGAGSATASSVQATPNETPKAAKSTKSPSAKPTPKPTKTKAPSSASGGGSVKLVFVAVGQGDAIIIKSGSWTGVIDGGPSGSEAAIEAALHRLGVSRLDAVVITHPHADHTGGLQGVTLDERPRIAYVGEGAGSDADELRQIGAKVVRVHRGQTLRFGSQRVQVLSPARLLGDANEDSVVLLLEVGGKRLLFTGDCTGPDEATVGATLARGPPLYLLKVAHHGSRYSSTSTFLGDTDPRYAVICVGANSYGHPTPETVKRLRAAGSTIYSTQKNGTITLTITAAGAASWKFASSSKPVTKGAGSGSGSGASTSAATSTAGAGTTVYITATGECYHVKGCRYLSKSCIAISLKNAMADGYRPCSVCRPPT